MNLGTNLGELGSGLFDWIIQTSWQAAVLVGLIWLVQSICGKRLSPGWRYSLWLLLVVRLLMPAMPASALSLFNLYPGEKAIPAASHVAKHPTGLRNPRVSSDSERIPGAVYSVKKNEFSPIERTSEKTKVSREPPARLSVKPSLSSSKMERTLDVSDWGLFLWLAGVCVLGLIWTFQNYGFRARMRNRIPVQEPDILILLEECRRCYGLRQRVTLMETEAVRTPAVYGLWHKRLVLPEGLLERFSREEIRDIFLHELAHIKRWDVEVNWLVNLLQILHWFNPVIWFGFARLRADRELATDALALSRKKDKGNTAYGLTIVRVLEESIRNPLLVGLVGIAENKRNVKRRLQAIKEHGRNRPWKWLATGITVSLGVISLTGPVTGNPSSSQPSASSAPPAGSKITKATGASAEEIRHFDLKAIEFDSSEPLYGVNIEFQFEYFSGEKEVRNKVTGTDGVASVEFAPGDVNMFSYRLSKPEYLTMRGRWRKQEVQLLPRELTMKMSRGTAIGGRVVDLNGNPVNGAEILFNSDVNLILSGNPHPIDAKLWTISAAERIAVTDSNGQWRAQCIWPTFSSANLRLRHPDFADAVFSTRITRAMEAEGKGHPIEFENLAGRSARWELTPGIEVDGRIVDEMGDPVSSVVVRYSDTPEANPFWELNSVKTGLNGGFQVSHLPQKIIYFSVQHPGYAPAVGQLDLQSESPEIAITLERGEQLEAQVVDEKGLPVPGARVSLYEWGIWQGVEWETMTDVRGRFTWPHAPTERYRLAIEKAGYLFHRKILQGGGEQVIELKPELTITGQVVDAETKKPLDTFQIIWADREEFLQQRRKFAVEGSDGYYTLDLGKLHEDTWFRGYAHRLIFRVEAGGYAPFTSRIFASREGDVGRLTYDIEMEPMAALKGVVLDAKGDAVTGAQLALKSPATRLRIDGQPRFKNLDNISFPETDENGEFQIAQDPEASHLIAVHEEGIAIIETKTLDAAWTEITLEPWGRVEGTLWRYDEKLAQAELSLSSKVLEGTPGISFCRMQTTTDNQGRFIFEFVPPGKLRLSRTIDLYRGGGGMNYETQVVEPGESLQLKVGGEGRPLEGAFTIKNPYVQIDWRNDVDFHSISTVRPRPPETMQGREEYEAWRAQPEVHAAFDKVRYYPIQLEKDGSFRIDEVIPGEYRFNIRILDPRDPDAFAYGRYIASFGEEFEVSDTDGGHGGKPLDLGVFEIETKPKIQEGKTLAPEFSVTDFEGGNIRLSDFHGEFVLLDFWATWCAPCIAELPYLKAAYEKYKDREDFTIISLSLDKGMERPREFVEENKLPWIHGFLGERSETEVPGQYGVDGIPAMFLVDPQGKIVAKNLRGPQLSGELNKWLK